MVAISIKPHTRLDIEMWEFLKGTSTFEKMIHNCITVVLDGPEDGAIKAYDEMSAWLGENNDLSLYYMTDLDFNQFCIYFESGVVQTAFALRFKDQEIENPPPPKKVAKSKSKNGQIGPSRLPTPYVDIRDFEWTSTDSSYDKHIYEVCQKYWQNNIY
jgi:hypothetical protein